MEFSELVEDGRKLGERTYISFANANTETRLIDLYREYGDMDGHKRKDRVFSIMINSTGGLKEIKDTYAPTCESIYRVACLAAYSVGDCNHDDLQVGGESYFNYEKSDNGVVLYLSIPNSLPSAMERLRQKDYGEYKGSREGGLAVTHHLENYIDTCMIAYTILENGYIEYRLFVSSMCEMTEGRIRQISRIFVREVINDHLCGMDMRLYPNDKNTRPVPHYAKQPPWRMAWLSFADSLSLGRRGFPGICRRCGDIIDCSKSKKERRKFCSTEHRNAFRDTGKKYSRDEFPSGFGVHGIWKPASSF